MANGITHEVQPPVTGHAYGIIGTIVMVVKWALIPISVGAAWAMLDNSVATTKQTVAKHDVQITDHEKRMNITETKLDRMAEDIKETKNDIKEILRRVK